MDTDFAALRDRVVLRLRHVAAQDTGVAGAGRGFADGVIRALTAYEVVAQPDEANPTCFVLTLDCTVRTEDAFLKLANKGARDCLAFFEDHFLVAGIPDASSVSAELGMILKSFTGRSKSVVAHSRVTRDDVSAFEIVDGRPGFQDSLDERFLHVTTSSEESWYWLDVVVDDERGLERVVERFGSQ